MKSSRTKNYHSVSPGTTQKQTNQTHRIDFVTIILVSITIILLILVLIFLIISQISRKNGVEYSQNPVIERVKDPVIQADPVEPILELGTPELKAENMPDVKAPSVDTEITGQDKARLFFIKFIDEQKIVTKSVLRDVSSSKTPLTMAIQSLLDGPRAGELSNDMFTLIPKDSRLLGARVDNSVAYLDFNEDFRFNTLGIDGYRAQVEQIVYTATELPTVDKVQILIDGQRVDYLGGEGFWVGSPLGREDFK